MTKAHPHRQVNVHLDTVDDADIIERIEAQPSMVGYIRELVRRDIHDERLDYAALKASELKAENAKLRELVITLANCAAGHGCEYCPINGGHGYIVETDMCESVHDCMRESGIEVEQ